MKRMILAVMTGSALMLAQFSAQAVITLTFEGLQQNEPILNYYNGGLGGFGSGPGANYGINFGADSLALNSGNYGNNPSQPGIAFFLTGPGDIMNVAAGFTTGFSFYYAAAQTGSVTVYDGLNGTGTVLATLSLAVTPSPYYDWVPVGVSFSGTAKSVNFSGVANYIGFDNVTLGAEVPTGVVPEPSTWLAGIGCSLSLLGGLVRKVRK